ncbi:MAG: transcriptional repressor [Actinomycetia bacterium]|nr:transcriptional repressor [Actinomycetes bacterium]
MHRAYGTHRVSNARRAIAEASARIGCAFTVEDLHRSVTRILPGVGLATVYRAVAAMLGTGYIACVGTRCGKALYAVCEGGAHHHHLVCTSCGAVTPLPCSLEAQLATSARRAGYTLTSHEVTLYGTCNACSRGASPLER